MAERGLMCAYAVLLVLLLGPCYITFVFKKCDFFLSRCFI